MFDIITENFFGIPKLKLCNTSSGEYLSILPTFGGNINELVLKDQNGLQSIMAGAKTMEELQGIPVNEYRGTKLSPFSNRIKNGCYVFADHRYFLPKNDNIHALHGLLWNQPFQVKEKAADEKSAYLLLVHHYLNTEAGYPFHYRIQISYRLDETGFSCTTEIINTDQVSIPIGDGWHPYFSTGSRIDTLQLKMPASRCLETDASLIPTGRSFLDNRFEQSVALDKMVLDDCFESDENVHRLEVQLVDKSKGMTISYWQTTGPRGYRYVHLYTPPDRLSIAIEPSTSAPDAFNNKRGLIVLKPGEHAAFEFGVTLK